MQAGRSGSPARSAEPNSYSRRRRLVWPFSTVAAALAAIAKSSRAAITLRRLTLSLRTSPRSMGKSMNIKGKVRVTTLCLPRCGRCSALGVGGGCAEARPRCNDTFASLHCRGGSDQTMFLQSGEWRVRSDFFARRRLLMLGWRTSSVESRQQNLRTARRRGHHGLNPHFRFERRTDRAIFAQRPHETPMR